MEDEPGHGLASGVGSGLSKPRDDIGEDVSSVTTFTGRLLS
jgi:hypothetical protein